MTLPSDRTCWEGHRAHPRLRELLPLEDEVYNRKPRCSSPTTASTRRVPCWKAPSTSTKRTTAPCMIPAAQCCLTYLDSILHGVNDYAKIIDIAKRGIKNAAAERETVNTGYFLLREALALDGSIHEEEEKNHAKGFGNQELVKEALTTYELAYKLNRSSQYRAIIRKRFEILCGKSGLTDFRLPEDE
ncbi:MAG: hypothetical protein ACLSVD_13305 [Eggerthellaceae bacterium]